MNKKDNFFDALVIVEEETTMLTGKDFDLRCYPSVRDEAHQMFSELETIYQNGELNDEQKSDQFAVIFNKYM